MMAEISQDIPRAASYLNQGRIIGLPTETVYGLAANALNPDAVLKIFEAKNRPYFDPLIVHTYSISEVKKYVREIPQKALRIAEAFWPGPLTLVLRKNELIPDLVTSGLDTVAIRVPSHPMALELLGQVDFPLAAPSANPFGYVSPTTAEHVNLQLGDQIPLILDGGSCNVGIESTIIGFEGNDAIIYRLGGKNIEDIQEVIGIVSLNLRQGSNPKAPGMLDTHYAPSTPLLLGDIEELVMKHSSENIGILSLSRIYPQIEKKRQIQLSEHCDLSEAAKNLFNALRVFDAMNVDVILAETVPDHGLGRAINDRLRRAAY